MKQVLGRIRRALIGGEYNREVASLRTETEQLRSELAGMRGELDQMRSDLDEQRHFSLRTAELLDLAEQTLLRDAPGPEASVER